MNRVMQSQLVLVSSQRDALQRQSQTAVKLAQVLVEPKLFFTIGCNKLLTSRTFAFI